MELFYTAILLRMCSLFVVFGAPAAVPSINYLKPFLVTNTKDGHNVIIHQLVGDGVDSKKYFFTPVPKLKQSSVKHEFNNTSGRHEVKFTVEIWNDDFLDELSSLAGIHRDFLSVYIADSVKLAATGPGWDSSKYSLAKKHWSSSDKIEFVIACRKEKHCEDLLQQIQQGELSVLGPNEAKKAPIGFELQFRDHGSAGKGVLMNVSVAHHVLPTMTFQRIVKKRLAEVLLGEADLNQFAEEVEENVLRTGDEDSSVYMDFSDPENCVESIKMGLFSRKVNSSAVTDWSTVLWDESEQQNRPDNVAKAVNRGFWTGEKVDLRGEKAAGGLQWLGAYASFVEWRKTNFATKTSTILYAVNAAKLRSLDAVGNVTVDIYPPDGVVRFPVTISTTNAGSGSATSARRSRRPHSILFGNTYFPVVVASLILFIGALSFWSRQRRNRGVVV